MHEVELILEEPLQSPPPGDLLVTAGDSPGPGDSPEQGVRHGLSPGLLHL
ncbi:hypothetical protein M404DRAFT_32913 [Pisolithus tinctorius Marx 270]|uniref:Uncharacterized protein n=1 Tax=Pisolithus tinctorius Marx 270 TaxID=870435 RepID=A0A0C3NN96_PISTI|nr:hypothetical protein M404DRAFT_32913 [Pisolithus tinctorius Marx 270]